jgi:Uma2 family endonuclease
MVRREAGGERQYELPFASSTTPAGESPVPVSARAFNALVKALEGKASVYADAPVAITDLHSEPEADVLVCSNPDFEAYGTELTTPLLVLEVAESSLREDLGEKATLYAQAGIPEYWVVNLVGRVVVVFREPRDGSYRQRSTLLPGASATPPLSWPDVEVGVLSLFPAPEHAK